jgi:hypothetical protein
MAIDLLTADLATREAIADKLPVGRGYGRFFSSSNSNISINGGSDTGVNFLAQTGYGSVTVANATLQFPTDNMTFTEAGIAIITAGITGEVQGSQHDVDIKIYRRRDGVDSFTGFGAGAHTSSGKQFSLSASYVTQVEAGDIFWVAVLSPDTITLTLKRGYFIGTMNV